ncbi:unnamed protein product [Kuraishia capsulata CBS 1993]|uniref:Acid phosphatase n=1 Tax=Kuraishia capsulata CBS 1993 TaxID=1382522 RepID=W6MTS3_9ASCO|nr:uncharacterized protein KUCA_T00004621001 [Kuraishia capsulata CBS 1993]CDK28637.1 unnamed protein product [Kuraishia capsulata CBS 1993]
MLSTTVLLSLVSMVSAIKTYDTSTYKHFYEPKDSPFSDLDTVFNKSSGTNGGFYNTSHVADSKYGAYNFCNMPHVRSTEYPTPNSSYTLEYVELMHRHHKRTPYLANTLPFEDISLYCDESSNYYYSGFNAGNDSTLQVAWANYVDPENPFAYSEQTGYNGTCQLPQISYQGLQDCYQHGKDVAKVYRDLLGFLPAEYDPELVQFRVTNNVITSEVLSAVAKAIYPSESKIKAKIQLDAIDSLEPAYTCDYATDMREWIYASDEWVEHLTRADSLYSKLDSITGVDPESEGFHMSFDHYFDNFAFRSCHGYDLPCSIDDPTKCVTQEDAEQVFRLGDFEWSYQYRASKNSTLYDVSNYGAFLNELKHRLVQKQEGALALRYMHNVGHDGSIGPMLGILQVDFMRWPGMGAELSFEMWDKHGDKFLRVLYGGQPLNTTGPLGTIDMIPLGKFVDYVEDLIGKDGSVVYDMCNSV